MLFQGSVNCWDGSERATPLFCAAAIENSKCLPILLASGADLNQGLHEYGLSAVHCATSSNAINNLTSLLQMGAQPNSVLLYRYLNIKFSHPYIFATWWGKPLIFQTFII